MALGGIILYLQQNLLASSSVSASYIVVSGSDYSIEIRTKFPSSTNSIMPPTFLSGSIWTISNGALGAGYLSLWYEKQSSTSMTGNLFLTSSAGRLQITSASIFNDDFYNIAVVRNHSSSSLALYVKQYTNGELTYSTSSAASRTTSGFANDASYNFIEIGQSALLSCEPQFWAQEFRMWNIALSDDEISAHAIDFENYGRRNSYSNKDLQFHWKLSDASYASAGGELFFIDSTVNNIVGTGSNFTPQSFPFDKFLLDYSYIPPVDYGWNQNKIRIFSGSIINPQDAYYDENFVSLEFNMYDALNEDISHIMTSYDELNNFLGLPINKYRDDYEGLRQMRETYFKRLQGKLNFRVFVDMLDFFDTSFVSMVEQLLPARSIFKGDEIIVESHQLERPKYQYQIRPVQEGRIDISGSISVIDRGWDFD